MIQNGNKLTTIALPCGSSLDGNRLNSLELGTMWLFIITMICALLFTSEAFLSSSLMITRRLAILAPLGTVLGRKKENIGHYSEGKVVVARDDASYSLYYRLYNTDSTLTPLVILHGGPSLPSQYLYPITLLVQKRPVLFFDQLGCGKSDEPKDLTCYSISQTVQDIESVLSQVNLPSKRVHLLGHSYGGVLGYELACKKPELVQSLILSNAPTNMKVSNDEYDRLYKMNPLTFWNKHACGVGTPPALQDAMAHAGSVWMGMDVVVDYVAQPSINAEAFPPTLVMSGSNDFAYKTSNKGAWRELLPDCAAVNFDHGAHYPFYESGTEYGRILEEFLTKYEENTSESD